MSASVSAETQMILDRISSTTRETEKRLMAKLDSVNEEIRGLNLSVEKNTKGLSEVNTIIDEQQHKITHTAKLVRTNAQNLLKNAIVIRGFPDNNFDVNEIAQNITAICDIKHGFNECYKFSRNIGQDQKTKAPKYIHIMHMTFISNVDKEKVFIKLKQKGHFVLGELLASCSEDRYSHQVWLEHSLTLENLKIRKQLLSLKRIGAIEKFVIRSGMFLVTQSNQHGKEKTFVVNELDQLIKMFPEEVQQETNNKRPRQSDSVSPNTQAPANKITRNTSANNRKNFKSNESPTTSNAHRKQQQK